MADRNIAVEVSAQAAQAELERLRAENAALKRDLQYARDGLTKGRTRMREDIERLTLDLKEARESAERQTLEDAARIQALAREAHAWWTAARDATRAERARCALRVALHSQYPIQTDYDRGYDKARKDAAETLRNMSTYVLTYAPDRPSTPVGWSDTDWLKHLEEIRQNEAAYARGPLPERGWD